MAITEEDIKLMSDDANKDTFTQCKPALDALKAEKDPSKQKELAKTILQNFVKEKTIYILKTNDLTKNVMAQLTDKIGEITDLDSFLKVAQENPEAKAALLKVLENGAQGGETPEGQTAADATSTDSSKTPQEDEDDDDSDSQWDVYTDTTENEEDPWIRSALVKLRSQKLY